MPIISNMQSADIEEISRLHLWKAAQLRMNGKVCEFFSFEVELSHKDPQASGEWILLVCQQHLWSSHHSHAIQLGLNKPSKFYNTYPMMSVSSFDLLAQPNSTLFLWRFVFGRDYKFHKQRFDLHKARKLQGEVISCHPTKKLCSRCWNGSAFHLWFWCSSHSICNILVNTYSMSGAAFCTGALSYNSLFENNGLSRIWPSVWSTLDRVVNDTLGLFPSGKTEEISPACLPPNPSRAVS